MAEAHLVLAAALDLEEAMEVLGLQEEMEPVMEVEAPELALQAAEARVVSLVAMAAQGLEQVCCEASPGVPSSLIFAVGTGPGSGPETGEGTGPGIGPGTGPGKSCYR